MFHYPLWKTLAIIASVLVAIFFAAPNALPPAAQQFMTQTFGVKPMTLGLDLQGGSNVLLEVDRKDMVEKLTQILAGDIRSTLREGKIGYSGIQRTGDGVTVRITKPEDMDNAMTGLNKLKDPVNGGVLSGGMAINLYDVTRQDQAVTFTINPQGLNAKIGGAIKQSLRIVENRINSLGTTEPSIQQQGIDRIAVQLPGIQNPDQVKNVIGTTAKLTFNLLCDQQPTAANQPVPQDCKALQVKPDPRRADGPTNMWVQTSSRAIVDGADLSDAQPAFDQNNQPVVTFRFNQKGAVRFGKLTAENVGKPFAIVLDDVVQSYPNINEPILGGSGQISGNFSVEETSNLAVVLRSGALPAKLTIVEERTVGPSLGSDSIRAGFHAAIIGLVLVMAFMIFAYGLFGIIADIALLINLVLLIAVMSFMGFTLTLPGIAGIVLTMGMAVDSNVIIFERIREEWRNGRSALSSIDLGFNEAFRTIFDANFTALIAALVLFGVGSGPVRGFAVTHAIGIMTTIYTAYNITRFIVSLWVRWAKPKEVPL